MNGPPDSITYVGHSTVLLEIDGARILTDPMLRSRAGFLRRDPPPVSPDSFAPLDLVLISHLHRDHLDLPSLQALPPETPLLVPRGAGRLVSGAGRREVIEIGAGEAYSLGEVEVTAVPAEHDERRGPWGPTAEPLGFVVAERSAGRLYFAGDTDLFEEMAGIGPLDVALLPVWGWGHKLGSGHLDPERAARALALLRPRLAVPIHWGTYYPAGLKRTLGPLLTDPPHEFARIAAERSPEVRVEVLEPGARLPLERMARP
jgi:L-ascorbate metabolism protein UlaG (beta-lactamase superfamily)